jgi:hypothetical protein
LDPSQFRQTGCQGQKQYSPSLKYVTEWQHVLLCRRERHIFSLGQVAVQSSLLGFSMLLFINTNLCFDCNLWVKFCRFIRNAFLYSLLLRYLAPK